jgi:hypothetical protein
MAPRRVGLVGQIAVPCGAPLEHLHDLRTWVAVQARDHRHVLRRQAVKDGVVDEAKSISSIPASWAPDQADDEGHHDESGSRRSRKPRLRKASVWDRVAECTNSVRRSLVGEWRGVLVGGVGTLHGADMAHTAFLSGF